VSIISTKSRNKQKPEASAAKKSNEAVTTEPTEPVSERAWWLASGSIVLIGSFLRLFKLAMVPLHHDEGVNGNFLVTLVRQGKYFYDPQNYHGPTLYYFSAIIPWVVRFFGGIPAGNVYGLTTFNIRLVTAVFGIGTIVLALCLRNRLGTIGTLSAAALIAISPGSVYLSRYFIHESLFVFFTLAIVVAALRYWDTANSLYLVLASVSAALMVATKETWIMNGPVLLIALVMTVVYVLVREVMRRNSSFAEFGDQITATIERFGGWIPIITITLVVFAVFILVNVFFYSSFFTNYPKGVSDALKTLNLWRQRTHEHEHPWYQYAYWLLWEEGVVFVLASFGAMIAVLKGNHRLGLFVALWSWGLLAAYSLVGYKTPWISLNFIVPMALASGYTIEVVYQALRGLNQARLLIFAGLLIVGYCSVQLYQLNFIHYDDDQLPYVYAHTKRQMLAMLDEIDRLARTNGTGGDTGIAIVSPDYWPLPWYFRDYNKVGYYQQIVPTNEAIIIGSMAQADQLKASYGDRYVQVNSGADGGAYPLRPGVDLVLYVRRDVKR
jgi:uncharacterized protein (TIGR03663 family)